MLLSINLRRFLSFAFLLFALSLTACEGEKSSETVKTKEGNKIYNVGIIQHIENTAFADMRQGFIQQMRKNGYNEETMIFHYKDAQGDSTNLNTISQEMAGGNYDFIVAIATPAAQSIVNMESETPVFYISVASPIAARIITDLQKPDKNATGASNAIPVKEIFELAQIVTPEAKTFGILYNTSEVNSLATVNQAKEYLSSVGLEYKEAIVTNSAEVQQAAQSLVDSVDAFFIPNDSLVHSAMNLVSEIAIEAKLPTYCASSATVLAGGLGTVAISDIEIGEIAADMAIEYINGKKIEEIPALIVPAKDTVISKKIADATGIEIPTTIENLIILE